MAIKEKNKEKSKKGGRSKVRITPLNFEIA